MNRTIIIGSRGSDLALWQANHIQSQLQSFGIHAEIRIIKTQGDKIQDLSFDKIEGKGFFTKELEDALLQNEIDLAVHSHKDLPTTSPEGLIIAAVSEREDPSELLLIHKDAVDLTRIYSLKLQARLGTSSARRKTQFLAFRPDVTTADVRGNVPTRVQKLREGLYDAILLAKAGLDRLKLDLSDFHVEQLDTHEFIPAPAQGVLAMQIRENDTELKEALQLLHHPEVAEEIFVERKVLNLFDGGCQLPLGVYCRKKGDKFCVWAAKADSTDGIPKRIYVESRETERLPQQIVSSLNSKHTRSVFITRTLDPDSFFFRTLQAHGYPLQGTSLIDIMPVHFSSVPQTDWIFFSSKHAVRHFFEQKPAIQDRTLFAAIGKGTEAALRRYGKLSSFTGKDPDPAEAGKAFAKLAEGQTVLFPQAVVSFRTVQQQFPAHTVRELSVYRTRLEPREIPYAEILVFTSPSNVKAFLQANKIEADHRVIAIGRSTASELEGAGISNVITAHGSEETALIETIFSLH